MESIIPLIFMHLIRAIVFNLEGELTEGEMPKRQHKFIIAWAELHKSVINYQDISA